MCLSTNTILNCLILTNYFLVTRYNDKIELPACQLLYAVCENIFSLIQSSCHLDFYH